MQLKSEITIIEYFSDINDPRIDRSKRHKLIDIVTIAICAVICGADTWEDIELFGDSKYKWLKEFLELPSGIPSHDTFARLFARINPQEFQTCFINYHEIRLSEQEHGREETRFCITLSDVQHLIDPQEEWSKITSVGMINSMRKCNGKTTLKTRYLISCLPKEAKSLTQIVRNHWNVENQLHWTLDVSYKEDDCRIRKGHAAQNFAILRHISLNLLNQEKHLKKGIRRKRNLAGWDNEYLLEILTGVNQL